MVMYLDLQDIEFFAIGRAILATEIEKADVDSANKALAGPSSLGQVEMSASKYQELVAIVLASLGFSSEITQVIHTPVKTTLHEPYIPSIVVQPGELGTEEGEFVISYRDSATGQSSLLSPPPAMQGLEAAAIFTTFTIISIGLTLSASITRSGLGSYFKMITALENLKDPSMSWVEDVLIGGSSNQTKHELWLRSREGYR